MAKIFNLGIMTVASAPGTGTISLGAAATIAGVLYLTFAQAGVSNGDTVAYAINDVGGSEVGVGTYTTAGLTLTRTVTKSTNSNTAITATAQAKVMLIARAEDIGNLGVANSWAAAQTFINSSGIKIQDTDASNTLGLIAGSNLSADRTLTLTTGDANRTFTLNGDFTASGTTSGTNTGDQTVAAAASQAQQEAGSVTTAFTAPGVQQYHPSATKAWCLWGVTSTITASYNIASITDNGVGDWTVNFSTSFSSANFQACSTYEYSGGFAGVASALQSKAAGNVRCLVSDTGAGTGFDPTANHVECHGDQ